MPNKIEWEDPLVSPGMACYAEKQEKPFWFSSLGQMVHFGAIRFCRTFKNYFGQFVWTEKKSHYNSRISLHEALTKNGPSCYYSSERCYLYKPSSFMRHQMNSFFHSRFFSQNFNFTCNIFQYGSVN